MGAKILKLVGTSETQSIPTQSCSLQFLDLYQIEYRRERGAVMRYSWSSNDGYFSVHILLHYSVGPECVGPLFAFFSFFFFFKKKN